MHDPIKDQCATFHEMVICLRCTRHEVVNVNLKNSPEWFSKKKNPLALVPVLERGDKIIYESAICNEYLDEVYGKQSLLTAEPYERARQKMLMERFSKVSNYDNCCF